MRSTQIDRKWPCVEWSPPITGTHPQRVSAHQEHFLYVFTENMRGIHLLVNSQSDALKVSGDQAVGISGRQIGVPQTPQILGANPLTKPGELSF